VDFLRLDAEDQRRAFGPKIAMVFQGNQNTLNPLLRIRDQVYDIGKAHGYGSHSKDLEERATRLITDMSMDPVRVLHGYPHELSGGMRQRVGIMLALLLEPDLIVLDEPTTALDVLSQAAVLRILARIKEEGRISFIFISHDISVVSQIVDVIAIMYAGHLVEVGPVESVLANPIHPYAVGLIGAIPPLWGDMGQVRPLQGHPPNMARLPSGCAFYDRCPARLTICQEVAPPMIQVGDRQVMCHLAKEEAAHRD
jgi:peptide/nickel transport system ATP-binding protein